MIRSAAKQRRSEICEILSNESLEDRLRHTASKAVGLHLEPSFSILQVRAGDVSGSSARGWWRFHPPTSNVNFRGVMGRIGGRYNIRQGNSRRTITRSFFL